MNFDGFNLRNNINEIRKDNPKLNYKMILMVFVKLFLNSDYNRLYKIKLKNIEN